MAVRCQPDGHGDADDAATHDDDSDLRRHLAGEQGHRGE